MNCKTGTYSILAVLILTCFSCQVNVSMTGGQFSGAQTFSVSFFKPQAALATQFYAQQFTESLKDLLQAQSPLKWVDDGGELMYDGSITGYTIAPVAIQGGESEIASLNRLTITVKVKYTNKLEPDLSFDRSFSKYTDFDADVDLFSVEENLWKEINDQLTQDIYNASVGNW